MTLRTPIKNKVYDNFYLPHHQELEELVNKKLDETGMAVIVDCHSFPDIPFETDLIKEPNRPDFCIGTDDFHTPKWLADMVCFGLTNKGFSVKMNTPYNGTIVPFNHFQKNDKVLSIMVEVNRKLYMNNGNVDQNKVAQLNEVIRYLLSPQGI